MSGGAVPGTVVGQPFAAVSSPLFVAQQPMFAVSSPQFVSQPMFAAPAPLFVPQVQQSFVAPQAISYALVTQFAPPPQASTEPVSSSTSQDIATVKKNTATILALLQPKANGTSGVSNPPETKTNLDAAAQFATTLKTPEDIDLHTAIVAAEKAKADAILKYLDNKKKSLPK